MSMDAVHEVEEAHDIGVCPEHNRVYECYSQQSYCLICPSCLMFGRFKGHSVCSIEEGARDLRQRINSSAKEGLLKFEKTETVLLDVRHAKLSLQENLQTMTKKAEEYFDNIIKTVKARKMAFLKELTEFLNNQLTTVEEIEASWLEKQEICQKVLKLQSSSDDLKIMEEAGYIVNGLGKLAEEMKYHEINLVENLQNQITVEKQQHSYEGLKEGFKTFVKRGPSISNKVRC